MLHCVESYGQQILSDCPEKLRIAQAKLIIDEDNTDKWIFV
tara:strand:+ start:44877 stop:44999 length:123 start_codon:yes stop_codon:yes gene_type:complete